MSAPGSPRQPNSAATTDSGRPTTGIEMTIYQEVTL